MAMPGIDSILLTDGNPVAHGLVRLFAQGCVSPENGLGGASRNHATDPNSCKAYMLYSQ